MDVSHREKLLRVSAVAELLDISDQRAYELIRSGMLPAIRVGRQIRVAPAALAEWIDGGGTPLPGHWRPKQRDSQRVHLRWIVEIAGLTLLRQCDVRHFAAVLLSVAREICRTTTEQLRHSGWL